MSYPIVFSISSSVLSLHHLTNGSKMFCRYSVDVNLDKSAVNKDAFRDPALKRKARRDVKAKLEEKWVNWRVNGPRCVCCTNEWNWNITCYTVKQLLFLTLFHDSMKSDYKECCIDCIKHRCYTVNQHLFKTFLFWGDLSVMNWLTATNFCDQDNL